MKEVFGNVWDYHADCVCIPTNGTVNRRGECVMGRGVARQAKERYPGLAKWIGDIIHSHGNVLHLLGELEHGRDLLCTFPVKHEWFHTASPSLIRKSAGELKVLAEKWTDKVFVLPRPGCGNGGLFWETVRPLLEDLPDNVHVIDLPRTSL